MARTTSAKLAIAFVTNLIESGLKSHNVFKVFFHARGFVNFSVFEIISHKSFHKNEIYEFVFYLISS